MKMNYLQPKGNVTMVYINSTLKNTSGSLNFFLAFFPLSILDPVGNNITITPQSIFKGFAFLLLVVC